MYILLLLTWIILNGSITLEILLIGMVIAAAIYAFMCFFLGYSVKKDGLLCKKCLRLLQYAGVLIWEIIKANITVLGRILSSKKVNEPVLVHFETDLKTKTARVILANSITLTPGTITVALEDNRYTVHCLDKSMAEGLDSSVFVRLLHKLEEGVAE